MHFTLTTNPENGETNTTLTHLEDGEGVEIYCNEGYMIYGDAVISCEKGSWSGIVTPECRPEEGMFDSEFFSFFHYEDSILTKVDPLITSNDSRSKRV